MSISKITTPSVSASTQPIPAPAAASGRPSTTETAGGGVDSTSRVAAVLDLYIGMASAEPARSASRAIGNVIANGALSNEVRAHLLAAQAVLDGVSCGCFDAHAAHNAAQLLCADMRNGAFTSTDDRQAVANAINVLTVAAGQVLYRGQSTTPTTTPSSPTGPGTGTTAPANRTVPGTTVDRDHYSPPDAQTVPGKRVP